MTSTRTPSRAVLAAAATGSALAAVLLEARVFEPRRLVVREVTLPVTPWPAALDGVRVALVADVHAGSPGVPLARVHRLVDRVVGLRPDLVLLLGDHLADVRGGRHLSPADVAAALAGLRAAAPVVGVLGNHDWYAGGTRVRRALESCGLPVLEESSTVVTVRGTPLWLAGVGDLWERRPSVARALADVPAGAPAILLTHNPDVVLDAPRSVSLTVAGHTHAGQVAFAGRPLHRVSPFTGNRLLRGPYDVDGRTLYVTSGVGTSLVPWRLGVVPELVVLTLRPAAPSSGDQGTDGAR